MAGGGGGARPAAACGSGHRLPQPSSVDCRGLMSSGERNAGKKGLSQRQRRTVSAPPRRRRHSPPAAAPSRLGPRRRRGAIDGQVSAPVPPVPQLLQGAQGGAHQGSQLFGVLHNHNRLLQRGQGCAAQRSSMTNRGGQHSGRRCRLGWRARRIAEHAGHSRLTPPHSTLQAGSMPPSPPQPPWLLPHHPPRAAGARHPAAHTARYNPPARRGGTLHHWLLLSKRTRRDCLVPGRRVGKRAWRTGVACNRENAHAEDRAAKAPHLRGSQRRRPQSG